MTDIDGLIQDAGGPRPGWQLLEAEAVARQLVSGEGWPSPYELEKAASVIRALRERIRELEVAPTSDGGPATSQPATITPLMSPDGGLVYAHAAMPPQARQVGSGPSQEGTGGSAAPFPTIEEVEAMAFWLDGLSGQHDEIEQWEKAAALLRSLSRQVAAKDALIAECADCEFELQAAEAERDSADANRDAFKDRAERAEQRVKELEAQLANRS